ncbi:MAG: dihydroxyacetone kinase subunit L [Pseudomonadota bacterium]
MGFGSSDLKTAAAKVAVACEAAADELNAQDGKLGDGDLGITVSKGWRAVAEAALPDDMGKALLEAAKVFQRVSSSSFGTLIATALMSAAKATKGRDRAEWSEVSDLLAGARDAMMARGKGNLGDKSVLDMMDALAKATERLDDPVALAEAVDGAATATLNAFRDKPNKLGRARMFGDKSIGLDDPGMLALRRMIDGLNT